MQSEGWTERDDRSGMCESSPWNPFSGYAHCFQAGRLVLLGTPPKEGHLTEGSQEEGKTSCYSPEVKSDFKIVIMLFAEDTRVKTPE